MHVDDMPPGGWARFPSKPEIIGAVAVVAPFVITIESYSTRNGELMSYSNLPATIGGVVAALCGLFALLLLGKTARGAKAIRIIAGVAILGGGAFQVARGTGAFFDAGSSRGASGPSFPSERPRDFAPPPDVGALIDACALGDKDVCPRARRGAKAACDAAKPTRCDAYGMFLLEGHGGPVDEAGAAAAFEVGCAAGDPQSCTNASLVYFTGQGVDKDIPKAKQRALQGCDAGNGNGCRNYGVILRDADEDLAGFRDAVRRGCEVEDVDAPACEMYGKVLRDGTGGPADAAASRAVFDRGCTAANSKVACWNLAQARVKGEGGDVDLAGAVAAFRLACDHGDTDGCNEAGVLLAKGGPGLPQDLAMAAQLYGRSCVGGTPVACSNHGVFLREGRGIEPNLDLAAKRFKRACEHEIGSGCYYLGNMRWYGEGAEPDRAAAKELFARACELKFAPGCEAADKAKAL